MDTKLTLKLDPKIIEKAKQYASDKKLSLSKLIENYLNALTSEKRNQDELEISPFAKSLATDSKVPADYDHKKEYSSYLAKKYGCVLKCMIRVLTLSAISDLQMISGLNRCVFCR